MTIDTSGVVMLLLGRRCVVHTSLLPLRRISPYLPSLVDGHCSSGIGGSGGAAAAAASCVRHKTNGGVPRTKRKYEPGANKYQVNYTVHGAVSYGSRSPLCVPTAWNNSSGIVGGFPLCVAVVEA